MKKKIIKLLGNLLINLSLIFIIKKIITLDINFQMIISTKNAICFMIITIIYSVVTYSSGLPWVKLMNVVTKKKLSFVKINQIYCESNLYKYLPSNFLQYVGRNKIAIQNKEIRHREIILATTFEMISIVCASIFVAICFSGTFTYEIIMEHIIVLYIFALVIAVLLIAYVLLRKKIHSLIVTYKYFFDFYLYKTTFFSVLYFIFILLVHGILLTSILYVISNENILLNVFTIIGVYSLSWLVGYITPGVPGGIGIRESMMCIILGGFLSQSTILSGIIIFRLINIIGDLFAYIFSIIIKNKFSKDR